VAGWEGDTFSKRNPLCDPDEVPELPADPVTRPGDLWLLGRHRLLCGDATKPDDLARLLPDGPADLLLMDPPYNVAYEGKTAEALTISNDDMTAEQYRAFLTSALSIAGKRLRPGGSFYLWRADTAGLDVRLSCAEAGLRVRQCLVWVKSVLVPRRQDYQWKHEPCLYGWAEGPSHTWLSDRAQTTVLEFDKPARNTEHPTTKPVGLFAYLIDNSCKPGGTVLDPFAGSGTSLIAAEQTGRTAP
jgi:DNA modification methylase